MGFLKVKGRTNRKLNGGHQGSLDGEKRPNASTEHDQEEKADDDAKDEPVPPRDSRRGQRLHDGTERLNNERLLNFLDLDGFFGLDDVFEVILRGLRQRRLNVFLHERVIEAHRLRAKVVLLGSALVHHLCGLGTRLDRSLPLLAQKIVGLEKPLIVLNIVRQRIAFHLLYDMFSEDVLSNGFPGACTLGSNAR
jgi:hypothetical protein